MDNLKQDDLSVAMENNSSIAFSDTTGNFTLKCSFYAKLILSDEKTKGFYTEIVENLLKYDRVRKQVGLSGVGVYKGREKLAFISLSGKRLRLNLALNPESVQVGRYKVKDVAEVKKFEKTPLAIKITSNGAKRFALTLIEELASIHDLSLNEGFVSPDFSELYNLSSLEDLIGKKYIKLVKVTAVENNLEPEEVETEVGQAAEIEQPDKEENEQVEAEQITETEATPTTETEQTVEAEPNFEEERNETENTVAESATTETAEVKTKETVFDSLLKKYGDYNGLLSMMSEGVGKLKLSQKTMLRSIDEMWVTAIEDCVSSLDELIRNPNHYIAENEEVMPIERTKRISGRSIAHLCRHTDYISISKDNEVKPTKMLNVFREDSILTYENKFLNTLINRLYMFVNRRYSIAEKYGSDEKLDSFEFENNFSLGDNKGRIRINLEYSERNYDKDAKKGILSDGLWRRVERLNNIVTGYINSSFVKEMGRNFVHPPIMRTNAILKNKYFRECLALWEFIESYDDAGYGIVIDETTKQPSTECVNDAYYLAAVQFMLFKYNAQFNSTEEETETTSVRPTFSVEATKGEKYTENTVFEESADGEYGDLSLALAVALEADAQSEPYPEIESDAFELDESESDESESNTFETMYKKTFHAKIRLASYEIKQRFAEIGNELLKYDGVKMRQSNSLATFYKGRKTLAKVAIIGKTIKFFPCVSKDEVAEKYHLTDVSEKKQFADTPSMLRVRSERGVKYAKELANIIAENNSLNITDKPTAKIDVYDYREESFADMVAKGWITLRKKYAELGEMAKDAIHGGHLFGAKTFGSKKSKRTEVEAKTAQELSVSESTVPHVKIDTNQHIPQPAEDANEVLKSLVRPNANYSKPTEFGLDDTSEFMKDDAISESIKQLNESENK